MKSCSRDRSVDQDVFDQLICVEMTTNRKITTVQKKRWEREWSSAQCALQKEYRDALRLLELHRTRHAQTEQCCHPYSVARNVCSGGPNLCKKLNSRIATTYNVAISGYYNGEFLFCVSATFAEMQEIQEVVRGIYGNTFYFVKATPKWYANDQITEFLVGVKWLCKLNDCLCTHVRSGQLDQESKEALIETNCRGTDDWEQGISQIMCAYRATLPRLVVSEDV